jgi:hypothetical protein
MLSSPELPPNVRFTILKYVEEKLAGLYGHNKKQLRRFAARVDPCNREVGSLVMSYWARPQRQTHLVEPARSK